MRPPTELQRWLDARGLTYEVAAARCRRMGREISDSYLKNIARGWNGPGYPLAKFLSKRLTRGAVSVVALMEYPYTRSSRSAA